MYIVCVYMYIFACISVHRYFTMNYKILKTILVPFQKTIFKPLEDTGESSQTAHVSKLKEVWFGLKKNKSIDMGFAGQS